MVAHSVLKSLIEIIKINMSIQKEIWVDSYCFPERYLVSNLGRVFNKRTKKFMKIGLDGRKQYPYLILAYKNQKKGYRLHRLVYLSFYPNTDISNDIHHLDQNIFNNKLSNLQALPHGAHRSMHAILSGKKPPLLIGKDNPHFKGRIVAINEKTQAITHIFSGESDIKLNSEFSPSRVYEVARAVKKLHKNHYFKRIPNDLNVEIGEIFDNA